MKYGIKIRDTLGREFMFSNNQPKMTISEYTGKTSAKTLEFDTIGDAEVYAQDHELRNYEVVKL